MTGLAESATKPQNDTIARSMSRYRRTRTATTPTATIDTPPLPALPAQTQLSRSVNQPSHVSSSRSHHNKTTPVHSPDEIYPKTNATLAKTGGLGMNQVRSGRKEEEELSEVEKARLREEAMRTLTMAERTQKDSRAQPLHCNNHVTSMNHESNDTKRASWKAKLGLARHKTAAAGYSHNEEKEGPEAKNGSIAPGGGGIVPGIDAPLSAVNAGNRRVLVRFKSTSFSLPVTPTTRAKDLIYSATNLVSQNIDPKTAIILESFSSLGLERPLRRYEHIRDVLNSWATDDANSLIISASPYEGATEKLGLKAVPSAQPSDATFYLYHSSRPGKWDKRYVTLRADGQVVVSKKSDAKEAKDCINICHISDFDIYTPTDRQLSKKLRPPKKICFAIKSQQKSSMFLSTENFVHFFSTNDSGLGQAWYDAVHSWRGWYLVHVLKVSEKHEETSKGSNTMVGDVHASSPQRRPLSTDSIPYQLGSFKPLVEFGRNADPSFETSDDPSAKNASTSTREMFLRKKKARDYAPPPSSFPTTLPRLDTGSDSGSVRDDDDSTFSPDSLLGKTYSQRLAIQREREARETQENDPFVSHGLLKNLSPTVSNQSSQHMPFSGSPSRHNSRSNTIRSHHPAEGITHSRSNSVRQKPKPLVDLTPVYREPPQHARKGHGIKVEAGVPLVEVATGPEIIPGVPEIPSATKWKRDQARPQTAHESMAAKIAPRRTGTIKSPHPGEFSISPDSPFIPNGLVALSGNTAVSGFATTGIGRGVATGHRHATRPLLDLDTTSQFAEGSLLRNIERSA